MRNSGQPYVFKVEDITPDNINKLIDQGNRFVLKSGLLDGVDEFDNLEEVLNGKVPTLCKGEYRGNGNS